MIWTTGILLVGLLQNAIADENQDNQTDNSTEETIDLPKSEDTEATTENSESTKQQEVTTPETVTIENTSSVDPEHLPIEKNETVQETSVQETSVQEIDVPDVDLLMQQIMQELAAEAEKNEDTKGDDGDGKEDDDFNYKGNLEYSYVISLWNTSEYSTLNENLLGSMQFSGDPQHYFNHNDRWGPTLGLRFQVSERQKLHSSNFSHLIGITTGLQIRSLRFNTAASWMWEQYYVQEELDRSPNFATYQYAELAPMSGVLWENTLTYAPDDLDFGLRAGLAFPFQIQGEREMGEAFTGSWQASSLLYFKFWQFGYTHIVYPNHSIERIQIGSGILF